MKTRIQYCQAQYSFTSRHWRITLLRFQNNLDSSPFLIHNTKLLANNRSFTASYMRHGNDPGVWLSENCSFTTVSLYSYFRFLVLLRILVLPLSWVLLSLVLCDFHWKCLSLPRDGHVILPLFSFPHYSVITLHHPGSCWPKSRWPSVSQGRQFRNASEFSSSEKALIVQSYLLESFSDDLSFVGKNDLLKLSFLGRSITSAKEWNKSCSLVQTILYVCNRIGRYRRIR